MFLRIESKVSNVVIAMNQIQHFVILICTSKVFGKNYTRGTNMSKNVLPEFL